MRSLGPLLVASALLSPLAAAAAPATHPLYELASRERAPLRTYGESAASLKAGSPLAQLGRSDDGGAFAPSALDCVHARHDIAVDPRSGATVATLDLVVRAGGAPLSSLGFTFDAGLTVGAVTAEDRDATFDDAASGATRIVRVRLSPPLPAGASTSLRVEYGGTLACGTPTSGGAVCTKSGTFAYFGHRSIFPFFFDPTVPMTGELDTMTRDVVLRVPADLDVVATGEKVGESISSGTKVSTWTIDKPLSRALGMYAFAGKLGMTPIPDRAVPTTFVFPTPGLPVDARLSSWSAPVLDFVERVGGGPLPFRRSMTLVRLPSEIGDPGTATFGMTLLSDSYARAGDLMYEETWAHENSHLFWGIVVPESDTNESRLMSEGLATLSQIDYTWAHHFGDRDRDEYLAQRFVPIGLDLRTKGRELPAVQVEPGRGLRADAPTPLYTLWAYYKTAATLDHLRATVGDEAFSRALAAYVERCSYVGCRPDDFEHVLEETTDEDLSVFFDRWVTSSTRPEVTIAFRPSAAGAEVVLEKDDELPMTLELWLELEDGRRVKQRVDLDGRVTAARLEAPAKVRSVRANPRHDVLVDARSAVTGDVDFDGESDGLDLLACASHVGQAYDPARSVGLWAVDEPFDPRCDLNHDLRIDREDLDLLAESFGTLRSP